MSTKPKLNPWGPYKTFQVKPRVTYEMYTGPIASSHISIPLFPFNYFLYFKAASQPIMKINTPNWSLGLVEYIINNDIDFT